MRPLPAYTSLWWYTPHDPMDIKLDIKDMAEMVLLELLYHPPGPEVPYLDHLVVARADEASRSGVKCESTDERVVTDKCAQALACRRIPHLDFAVARAGYDEIILLPSIMSTSRGFENTRKKCTLNSIHASPRSCPSKVRKHVPRSMSHNIIFVSPLALTMSPLCNPMELTGPSCPERVRYSSRVSRFQTRILVSLELLGGW